ncbi:MAG: hypothetical protein ABMB14_08580 [Myxococcota bacterium]
MWLTSVALAAGPSLDYAASPDPMDGPLRAIRIELRITGDADGRTTVALPHRWVGATDYAKYVQDLTVDGATIDRRTEDALVLVHPPEAAIAVRYAIGSAWDEDPPGRITVQRLVVPPDLTDEARDACVAAVAGA